MVFSSWKQRREFKRAVITHINVTRLSYRFLRPTAYYQKFSDSSLLLQVWSMYQWHQHHQRAVRNTAFQTPPRALENIHFNQIPEIFMYILKFGKHCYYECWAISDLMPSRYSGALNVLVSMLMCLQIKDSSIVGICSDKNKPFQLYPSD